MKKLLLSFLMFLVLQPNILFGQNPYIREGSIGKQKVASDIVKKDTFSFRPISSWIGERFIFLPSTKSLQKYGYQSFKGGDGRHGHPSYNKYVGRIAKVVSVNKRNSRWDVQFEMEDNGHRLTATAYLENIHDIAPIADIDNARSRWIGKTLWYADNKISTYNEDTGKFGSIKVRRYSPVKVIDIVIGWYNYLPIRFILQTSSGEEGFEDINLSGTNIPNGLRDNNKFEESFLTQDPKIMYKWSNRIWSAIEDRKVFVGMTVKQTRMSWGKPKEINKTVNSNIVHEQWVYRSSNYLYFENGILTTIQN